MPRLDPSHLPEIRMNAVTLALAALTLAHGLIAVTLALAALTLAHGLIAWLAVRRLRLHHAAATRQSGSGPATD